MNEKVDMEKIKERVRRKMHEEFGLMPRIKIFAFGGGAGRIAEYIARKKLAGVKIIGVNADARVMNLELDKRMHIGKDVLGFHRDTNGEPKVAEYIVDRHKAWIIEEAMDADAIVILAAPGGGMGSGGSVEAMRILKNRTDKPVMAIFLLPFSVEREQRARAMKVIETVKNENLGSVVVFDSDDMLNTPDLPIFRGYQKIYENIVSVITRLTAFTKRVLEEKFDELYLSDIDEIVAREYRKIVEEEAVFS